MTMHKLALAMIGLVAVSAPSVLAGEDMTRKDFEELCDAFEGYWIGEVTWVADWEGIGKRGETVTAYVTFERKQDSNLLSAEFYGGKGSGTWSIVYDAHSKRIRTLWVASNGDMDQAIIYRDGDKWVEAGAGSSAAGEVLKFNSSLTISENGTKHVWKGSSSIDGEENDPRHDTWYRIAVSKEGVPGEEFLEFAELMEGRWLGEIKFIHNWSGQEKERGDTIQGYHLNRLEPSKRVLLHRASVGTGNGYGLYAWDSVSQQIRVSFHNSGGDSWQGIVRKLAKNKFLISVEVAATGNGESGGGGLLLHFSEDGRELKYSGQITIDGQAVDPLTDVYRKVSP